MNKVITITRAVAGLVLLFIFLVFCMENLEKTKLEFLSYQIELPLFIVLIITLSLGAFLGYLAGIFRKKKEKESDSGDSNNTNQSV